MITCNRLPVVFALVLLLTGSAQAQKAPALGYVYPPAVPSGTATEVQAGGYDFTSDMQWMLHDEQIAFETNGIPGPVIDQPRPYWTGPRLTAAAPLVPREVTARIIVPPGTPEGLFRWQVANANGASDCGVFYVGGQNEIIESRSRDFPQVLSSLPVAVSGRISRLTEVDRYEFRLPKDAWVTAELMARRLGANFAGVIKAEDSRGRLLADHADTQGMDGRIAFPATANEVYTISVRDADFTGDRSYVYRLSITTQPQVIFTLPSSVTRGIAQNVTFLGTGIAAAAEPDESSGSGNEARMNGSESQLGRVTRNVTVPADFSGNVFAFALETSDGVVTVPLPVTSLPELTLVDDILKDASGTVFPEVTDNTPLAGDAGASDSTSGSQIGKTWSLTAAGAVTAFMSPELEEHRFQWPVEKDQFWKLAAQSRAIGGSLDMAMTILSPSGQTIADVDDVSGMTDSTHEFRATEAGLYTVVIRCVTTRSGRAGERYRLQLLRPEPDFSLTIPPFVNVPSAGKAEMPVQVVRSGGFDGEIALELVGLPEGVSVDGVAVIAAGAAEVKLPLNAAADAAVIAAHVKVLGRAKIADQEVTRIASAVTAGNLAPRVPEEARTSRTLVAMTMSPPIEVQIVDRETQNEVPRGTSFPAAIAVVRNAPFAGPIRLEISGNQGRYRAGMRNAVVIVPPGETKTHFPCFVPEWAATDVTQRVMIHGVAEVPDPKGTPRQLIKAAGSRITMIMEGALLKLSAEKSDFVIQAGETTEIQFRLQRSPKLPLSTTVQIEVPEEVNGLLTATPVTLTADQTQGVLHLNSKLDERLSGPWKLRLSAQSLQQDRWPVISVAEIDLEFTVPQQSAAAK